MFEKWRIKEHMEVSGANGEHLGTVDSIDGDVMKLTRSDSADGQHHFIDVKWIDRIDENRAYLKPEAPLETQRAEGAHRSGHTAMRLDPESPAEDPPLFGTSGHGTGMGGSGVGS